MRSAMAWAEKDSKDMDERDEEVPENAAFDDTPITKKQRHVFQECLLALPGAPNSLPQEVAAKHAELRASTAPGKQKAINALVNSVIDKDVGYSSIVDFRKPGTLTKFECCFKEKRFSKQSHGLTKAEVVGRLGGGDIGKQGLVDAIADGDIVEKNGLFFWKRLVVSEDTVEQTGFRASQEDGLAALGRQEFLALSDAYGGADWLAYGLSPRQASSSAAPALEDCSPASDMALLHLQDAHDAMQRCCSGVQKLGIMIRRLDKGKTETLQQVLHESLKLSTQLQEQFIKKMSTWLVEDPQVLTDSDIKRLTKGSATMFSKLLAMEKELGLLHKAAAKDQGTKSS